MTRTRSLRTMTSPVFFPVLKTEAGRERKKSLAILVKLKVKLIGTLARLLKRPVLPVRLVKKFQKGLLTAPK